MSSTDWSDPAAWYDVLNPWGLSDDHYLGLVLSARRVLDVGCGTGTLLRRARERGHGGRLCGLEPDPAMRARARVLGAGLDIEWVRGDAASADRLGEFDLVVMASHAFQFLADDGALRRSLAAIRAALAVGGRFAFETRHPQARAWLGWNSSFEARNPDGDVVLVGYETTQAAPGTFRVAETLTGPWWEGGAHTEVASLRFLDPDTLDAFLLDAGFDVEQRFGDWDGGAVTARSEEIVTIARRR